MSAAVSLTDLGVVVPSDDPGVIQTWILDTDKGTEGDAQRYLVGWDMCGVCLHSILVCECEPGPRRPPWVEKFALMAEAPEIVEWVARRPPKPPPIFPPPEEPEGMLAALVKRLRSV